MIRLPPSSTPTDTLFPYTTLFRSSPCRYVSSTSTSCPCAAVETIASHGSRTHRIFLIATPPTGSSQSPRRLGHCPEQRTTLAHRLLPLLHRIGVVDDAGAGLHVQAAALDHRGADRDRHVGVAVPAQVTDRSEEHTSELQSLMRISYAVFCLQKK